MSKYYRKKYPEPVCPEGMRWCLDCKQVRAFKFHKINGIHKYYVDENGHRWQGRRCWDCFYLRNKDRIKVKNQLYWPKYYKKNSKKLQRKRRALQLLSSRVAPLSTTNNLIRGVSNDSISISHRF